MVYTLSSLKNSLKLMVFLGVGGVTVCLFLVGFNSYHKGTVEAKKSVCDLTSPPFQRQ